jgi:hypothetical protein
MLLAYKSLFTFVGLSHCAQQPKTNQIWIKYDAEAEFIYINERRETSTTQEKPRQRKAPHGSTTHDKAKQDKTKQNSFVFSCLGLGLGLGC